MKYNGIIQRKLSLLDDQVIRLELLVKSLSLAEFTENWIYRSAAERGLQVCAEIMTDIAERIIALENAGPVATAADAFRKLSDIGIVKNAEMYQKIIRFRNLVVHEYESIDPALLYSILRDNLKDFRLFRDEIDRIQ